MKNEYDFIVIGAGLSSLMFLSKMISNKSKLSILVLEQKRSIARNQTFCVWEGPGLINIEKEFKLKAKHRWNKILIENNRKKIKKDIHPYHYVCHDGHTTLKKLSRQIKGRVKILYATKVTGVHEMDKKIQVNSSEGNFYSKYIVDSRPKIEKNEIKSAYIQQAFIGSEIEVKSNYFNKYEATIMSFSKNKKETEFIYQLPFTKKRALVETTLFSKSPDLKKLQQKHTRNLKKYGDYKILKGERGIIPMALIEAKKNKRIMKVGMSAGMVRASSGYSMRKIANWVLGHKGKTLKKNNLLSYSYSPNPLLDFFDKIFLAVLKNHPNKSPNLFINLFEKSNHKSLIKFLSDTPSWKDNLNVVLSMPKKLMLKTVFKQR
jgi:lycopene beta-cyclase